MKPLQILSLSLLLLPGLASAQIATEATDFRYVLGYYPPPYQRQMKALLEGARALPLPDGRSQITGGKLHSFLATGQPQMNVQAPQAFCNQSRNVVYSAGPLQVDTADGKFSIQGEGFQWQTNAVLFISNRVHTVVQSGLLEAKSATAQPATGRPPLHIFSDRFHYAGATGLAVYRDRVRVCGTNLLLTSGVLTLKVPMAEKRLETIRAQQHVILDYTNEEHRVHATGGQALYSLATGLLEVTQHPVWQTDLRQGGGDKVLLDRTNEIFQALGRAWLRMQVPAKGGAGFLPQVDLLATNSSAPVNQVVEIHSDDYEFRTNSAVFSRHVHLVQHAGTRPEGTLDCERLSVAFTGSNQVQRMVAERGVVLAQEDKAFTGSRAVYTPTNGWLELTGHPAWRAGLRRGKGDLLLVNLTNSELIVRGNASMRVPAREVVPAGAAGPLASKGPAAKGGTNQFADIFAEEYTLRRDHDRLLTHFRGGVYISHAQMNLMCATMRVSTPLEANRGNSVLTADQDVQFDLLDDRNEKHHGTGDRLVFTHSLSSTATNDIAVLTGTPAVLQSTNGASARNDSFTLDLRRGTISGSGHYQFTGVGPAVDTNKFKLLKK